MQRLLRSRLALLVVLVVALMASTGPVNRCGVRHGGAVVSPEGWGPEAVRRLTSRLPDPSAAAACIGGVLDEQTAGVRGKVEGLGGLTANSALRSALRAVAIKQQAHKNERGYFAESLAALGVTPAEQVVVRILHGDARGWAAEARLLGEEGSCVVYSGRVRVPRTRGGITPSRPSDTVCD